MPINRSAGNQIQLPLQGLGLAKPVFDLFTLMLIFGLWFL